MNYFATFFKNAFNKAIFLNAFLVTANGPARVTVAMVGKFAISASFANVYVLTAEIFPTPLR